MYKKSIPTKAKQRRQIPAYILIAMPCKPSIL
jgi:hypothetical protein